MRNFLLSLCALIFVYGCTELSGKEPPRNAKADMPVDVNENHHPPDSWRVGKTEAQRMRKRRGNDNTIFRIAANDLRALLETGRAADDTVVIYLVKYDFSDANEKRRYAEKVPNANWKEMKNSSSGILVGLLPGVPGGMHLTRRFDGRKVTLWDMAVVCPPPPDCECDITD